mmetsp:Transcript_59682/g.99007  ORF Transcript_59682/g.99007 Transcript_59682/m.99007 type:complete len:401 (-) Transcript_59682:970-2172(-)
MAGLHQPDGPGLVRHDVQVRQVQGLHPHPLHVDRHERALRLQLPRSDHGHQRAAPRRSGPQGRAQPVRVLPDHGHVRRADAAQPRAPTRHHDPTIPAVPVLLHGDPAVRRDLDRRQRGQVEPPGEGHPDAADHVPECPVLRGSRRRRVLRQSAGGVAGPMVSGRGVHALLPGPCTFGDQAAGALALWGGEHAPDPQRHSVAVPCAAVHLHHLLQVFAGGALGDQPVVLPLARGREAVHAAGPVHAGQCGAGPAHRLPTVRQPREHRSVLARRARGEVVRLQRWHAVRRPAIACDRVRRQQDPGLPAPGHHRPPAGARAAQHHRHAQRPLHAPDRVGLQRASGRLSVPRRHALPQVPERGLRAPGVPLRRRQADCLRVHRHDAVHHPGCSGHRAVLHEHVV